MKQFLNINISPIFLASLIGFVSTGYAQQGKNGAKTISTVNTVVNEYTSLTANATAGSSVITVANSTLNTNNRFTGPLAQGDLVMIIQMQGAAINGTATDSTWGSVTAYNNCGLYEFAEVASVPNSTTINFNCTLRNSYTTSGKVQVVRVPRYTSLEVTNSGVLTGDAWTGTQGGIVATEVQNATLIDSLGAISATGLGFRGGIYVNITNGPPTTYLFASTDTIQGGEQGESVAGFENDYNVYGGRYGRGAPGNGGGGGNSWNCPGGGGANAGNINAYTGNGNPDITTDTNWIKAWNLEYNGFANSVSSGGGRGGYNVGYTSGNPLVNGPNSSIWSQYLRANTGGKGGRPLDYSAGRIFFGGGGGSCKADNNNGSSGANGGGMVYLISYGTVTGTGKIIANGNTALNANCGVNYGDPPGGGGGGGAVIINSSGPVSGISVFANGGNGGNQIINDAGGESEGAGGGGGGGYIAISNGNITRQALGGVNGTTNSSPMAQFPPDGATKGGDGLPNEVVGALPFSSAGANAGSNVTICSGDTAQLSVTGGATFLWAVDTTLSCTACRNPVAMPVNTTTYTVTVTSGLCSSTDSVVVTVLAGANAGIISAQPDSVCAGASSQLTVTGASGTIQWQSSPDSITFTDIAGQSAANYTTPALTQTEWYRVQVTSACGSRPSAAKAITVFQRAATGSILVDPNPVCAGSSSRLSITGISATMQWQDSSALGTFTSIAGTDSFTYFTPPLYQPVGFTFIATNGGCTDTSISFTLLVNPAPPPPVLSVTDSLICSSDSALIRASGSYSSYQWNTGASENFIYATTAGNYWVSVTDQNGCTAVSARQNISVYPVPSVSIVRQGDTLTSFGQVHYQWLYNNEPVNGATGPVFIANQSGSYSLEVTDTNGCTTISNPVDLTTGISELKEEESVSVYPNPSVNGWQLTVDGNLVGSDLEIFDDEGRLAWKDELRTTKYEITATGLASGVYYLRIGNDRVSVVRKLVKIN